MRTYSSRNEAIEFEIIQPIEATRIVDSAWYEYDITAIADRVLGGSDTGYALKVDEDAFWEIVEGCANEGIRGLLTSNAVPTPAAKLRPGHVIADGIVKEVSTQRSGVVFIEFTNGASSHALADDQVDVIALIVDA